MAFLEQIGVAIGMDPKEARRGARAFIGDLKDMKKAAAEASDGLSTIGKGFGTVGKGLGEFRNAALLVTGAVTGMTAALYKFTAAGAESADTQRKAAQALGLTIEQYGRLKFAAEQAGLDQKEFDSAFVQFSDHVQAAQRGDRSALEMFRKLGVRLQFTDGSIRDINVALFDQRGRALSVNQVLNQVANNFARVGDGARKTELAVDVFGRRLGPKLIPLLNGGAAGLKEVGDQAVRLGAVFTAEQGKIGEDFQDAANRTKTALRGLRDQIAITFAPELTQRADQLTEAIVRIRPQVQALAERGFLAARQAALDLFNAFTGNDSAVVNAWVLDVRDNVIALRDTIAAFENIILPLWARVRETLDVIAIAINDTFGTNLTGAQLLIAAFVIRFTGGLTIILGAIQVVVGALQVLVGVLKVLGSPIVLRIFSLIGAAALRMLLLLAAPLAALLGLPTALVAAFIAAGAILVVFWDDIIASLQAIWDFAGKVGQGIIDIFKRAGAAAAGFFGFGNKQPQDASVPGYAAGGRVAGPGSGTSDSILAALSNGEFVMRAAAVQKFGAPFFDALNRGLLPAFADGGQVGAGGRPVVLDLGGASFPASMQQDVLDQLTRHARAKSRRSPGRAPSWKT